MHGILFLLTWRAGDLNDRRSWTVTSRAMLWNPMSMVQTLARRESNAHLFPSGVGKIGRGYNPAAGIPGFSDDCVAIDEASSARVMF